MQAETVCNLLGELIHTVEQNKECFQELDTEIASVISLEVCTFDAKLRLNKGYLVHVPPAPSPPPSKTNKTKRKKKGKFI